MFRDTPLTSTEANKKVKSLNRFTLPDGVVPEGISLETFVERFVTDWAIHHPTLYEHSGEQQTRKGARRSLGDITRLAQTYFGTDVCLEEIKNILKALLKAKKIDTLNCNQIKKRVFFVRSTGSQLKHMDEPDEYGWKFNLEKKTKVPKKKKAAVS